jgi:ribosomal protein S13
MIGRRLVAGTAVVAAVAAGGVTGALIGVPGLSGAATSTTTKPNAAAPEGPDFRGHLGPFMGAGKDVLDAGAKALKLSTTDLLAKLRDGKTTIADVAKQQNVDVQTVIDAMAAVAKSDITDLVNNPLPVPSFPDGLKGPGFGFGHRGGLGDNKLGAAAKALGITTDELMKDLRNGQSMADVAKAKSVDVSKVIDALVSDAQSSIDAAVKDGHLTQAEATKLKADLKTNITDLVNNTPPKGERHFSGGGFGPGGWEHDSQRG